METLGYYNGTIGTIDQLSIPFNDRVHWFGDGVYDAGPARNYRVFAMDEHVDRLFVSARLVEMEMPIGKDALKDLLRSLVRKLDSGDQFVYVQVTRGSGMRRHEYPEGKANLWVMLKPQKIGADPKPGALITTEDRRFEYCNVKTLNLLPSVMAAEKAARAGAMEAVFVRPNGIVTECAHSNVHFLKDGKLVTHPADRFILPGIARKHLIGVCGALGVPVEEREFGVPELAAADEILVTSSSKLIRHANSLDGKPAGGKASALLERIRAAVVEDYLEGTK